MRTGETREFELLVRGSFQKLLAFIECRNLASVFLQYYH